MAKIKQKMHITEAEADSIRRSWDKERREWYFSVADVMAVLTESVDARNYWKALKNRLKSSQEELVMDINQLKMKASDGKSYLVDVADAGTMLKIIQIVAPFNVSPFRSWFEHIEVQGSHLSPQTSLSKDSTEDELSTTLEPLVDIYENNYQNKKEIVVEIMLPATPPEKIIISATCDILTIRGERKNSVNISEDNYLIQELQWGEFEKIIELPNLADVENISATEYQGLITITLSKIDREKTRYIKIKNL